MPDTSSTAARRWSAGWRGLGGQTRLYPLDRYRRLPEYGPHLYKPATGEAVIFSCSMLHGERYVLLAFLYGDDGARQKAEMARRMEQAGG
ncbi:MAG TPA: hypothetical protein VGB36_09925 [Gammaproteobacteria bacterium]